MPIFTESRAAPKPATSEFEDFFHSEYPRLFRALYLLTRSTSEAEDIAQEAMAKVYERWERVRGMDSPSGYLYRIAMNEQRGRVRRLVREARLSFQGGAPASDPSERVGASNDVLRALHTLPVRLRDVLVLQGLLGLETEEISQILKIKPPAVRTRLHRARRAFKEALGDDYS